MQKNFWSRRSMIASVFIMTFILFSAYGYIREFEHSLKPPTPPLLKNVRSGSWSLGTKFLDCASIITTDTGSTDLLQRLGPTVKIGADGRKLFGILSAQGFHQYRPCPDNNSLHAMQFYQRAGSIIESSPIEAIVIWLEDSKGRITATHGNVEYRYEGP